MQKAKQYYDKMIDFKQYGIVMLAASVFFYLGVIIPSVSKSQTEITMMMIGTIAFLAGSISFFFFSKSYRQKLLETEEGQEYLNHK